MHILRTATCSYNKYCVPILLAPRALWNITFDVRRLDFYHCVEEGCDFIYVLICGMLFDIHKVDGQWFICGALFNVPNVRHVMALFLKGLFDIVDIRGGMEILKHNPETSVLSGFICMEFSISVH